MRNSTKKKLHDKMLGKHSSPNTEFTSTNMLGEKNPNWKGGRVITKIGYILIKAYNHPKSVRGYMYEHIVVVEKKLGRYLIKGEEVHHINGNKSDNSEENLIVLTKIQHLKEHPRSRNHKGQFESDNNY